MNLQIEEMVEFFSRILDQTDISYAITGGVASATFGRARTTKDVGCIELEAHRTFG